MGLFDRFANLFAGKPRAPFAPPPAQASGPRVRSAPPPPPDTPTSGRVLVLRGLEMRALDEPLGADISIDLTGCRNLTTLPAGLTTGTLTLAHCTAIEALPQGMSIAFLDLEGCTALRELPADLRLRGGRLSLKGCAQLTRLPDNLGEVATLDLSGCKGIASLPAGLTITSWIDVGDSGIRSLSELYDPVGVRWNGVPVSRQTAFAPETITAEDIAAERDPEARALMAKRAGLA
jgi:hypothetical protein